MRKLFLERQGLAASPSTPIDKKDVLRLVKLLAYVQVDSINVVERAHHMILYSRNRNYRREMLTELIEKDRELFEHWTHDASILPASYFPHWRHRFGDIQQRIKESRWRSRLGAKPELVLEAVMQRIRSEGGLRTRDFENAGGVKRNSWWGWTEEKSALELLWRCGELGIRRRERFEKVYDRMELAIPARYFQKQIDRAASVDGSVERRSNDSARRPQSKSRLFGIRFRPRRRETGSSKNATRVACWTSWSRPPTARRRDLESLYRNSKRLSAVPRVRLEACAC